DQLYYLSDTVGGGADFFCVWSVDAVYVGGNLLSPDDYEVHLAHAELGSADYIKILTNIGNSEVTVAVNMDQPNLDFSASTLVRRMLLCNGVFDPVTDLDYGSFAILREESPGPCGYYSTGDTTLAQGVSDLLAGAMYWTATATGKF